MYVSPKVDRLFGRMFGRRNVFRPGDADAWVKASLIAVMIGSASERGRVRLLNAVVRPDCGPAMKGRDHLRDACGLSDPLRQPELGVDALAEGDVVGRS